MDYDAVEIADVYDEARTLVPGVLDQWLNLITTHAAAGSCARILDVGCGTGRFSDALAARFGARVVAIDPSQKMLNVAHEKLAGRDVTFLRARAESLPLAGGAIDIAYMSMVLHHIGDKAAAARESRRVLREGGRIFIRNTTQEADFPYRRFFPTMRSLIELELPSRQSVTATFLEAGFELAAHEIVTQVVATDWLSFARKCSLRADSFLARLDARDFPAGMAALNAHASKADPRSPVTEEIDLFVFAKPRPQSERDI